MKREPCVKCGSEVLMMPMYGGRAHGESTAYAAECMVCGPLLTELPSSCNGRKDSAQAEYNRWAKSQTAKPEDHPHGR